MEGIDRFVMKSPIKVDSNTLSTIKSKAFNGMKNPGGNARIVNRFHDIILFQKDHNQYCTNEIPDSIKDMVDEELEEMKDKAIKEP